MHKGKSPSAQPFSHEQQRLWGIVTGIAFIAIGGLMVLFFIMAKMVDDQGSQLNGVIPLTSFGAVIILLSITIWTLNNGKDGKWSSRSPDVSRTNAKSKAPK